MALPLDPVWIILLSGTVFYIAQAAILSGASPVKMIQRLYKDTTIGFVILFVTAMSAQYYMLVLSDKTYPFLPAIIGVMIGMTLERKIANFFQLKGGP